MEDTLRERLRSGSETLYGLNPCFNGRYSQRKQATFTVFNWGLNPCFNGRYSQRPGLIDKIKPFTGLNPCFNGRYSQRYATVTESTDDVVLILVLMEDTLRVFLIRCHIEKRQSLNPCFNGRYSQSSAS